MKKGFWHCSASGSRRLILSFSQRPSACQARTNILMPRETKVYLSLGSNMGDSRSHIEKALETLENMDDIRLGAISDFYRTRPVETNGDSWFINCVVELTTQLDPLELLDRLEDIEISFGRNSKNLNMPRTLDIDILLYGEMIVSFPRLAIPHPKMALRRFVLEPLSQIAPSAIHPILRETAEKLMKKIDGQEVFRVRQERFGNA